MAKQKVSKANQKAQEEANKRAEAFKQDIVAAQEKHGFKLYAILEYKVNGIVPSISIQEVKKENINVKTG